MVLGLLLVGCETTTPVINTSQTPDRNYFKTKYFDGKNLSSVEGIWRWMNGNYQKFERKCDSSVTPIIVLGFSNGRYCFFIISYSEPYGS